MAGIKGYPSQEKLVRHQQEFSNVEPVAELLHALSILAYMYMREVGVDAAEAGSTTISLVATAHAAKKGDVVRFTSGTLINEERRVYSVSANAIEPVSAFSAAPSAADTFQILRHKSPIVTADGRVGVSAVGGDVVDKIRHDYTATTVTTGAWVELIASLAASCSEIEIFDSSGETMVIGVGAAASEIEKIYVFPGGNGKVSVQISAGERVAIKAVSASASVGEFVANFYS